MTKEEKVILEQQLENLQKIYKETPMYTQRSTDIFELKYSIKVQLGLRSNQVAKQPPIYL